MAIKVELRPHVAKERHPVGGGFVDREEDFGQCLVFVDGKQVGVYCGRANEPGKFLSFIEYQPPDVQKMLAEEVAKITGAVGTFKSPPKEEHDVN